MTAKTKVYIGEAVRMAADRSRCPSCNAPLTGAAGMTLHKRPDRTPMPDPGDVTVCGYCGEILQYLFDYSLARIVPEEFAKLSKTLQRLVKATSDHAKAHPMAGPRE